MQFCTQSKPPFSESPCMFLFAEETYELGVLKNGRKGKRKKRENAKMHKQQFSFDCSRELWLRKTDIRGRTKGLEFIKRPSFPKPSCMPTQSMFYAYHFDRPPFLSFSKTKRKNTKKLYGCMGECIFEILWTLSGLLKVVPTLVYPASASRKSRPSQKHHLSTCVFHGK